MNRINPQKLLLSKWTARRPVNRERHFMVTRVLRDEHGKVTACELEAVLSRRTTRLDWRELKDSANWSFGWS